MLAAYRKLCILVFQITNSSLMPTMPVPKINYNPRAHIIQLDGIRGWAILLVLLYHFFADYSVTFRMGWMGVDLFFVLSGFLITGILVDSEKDNNYYRNFYIKRVLRIFPLYYVVLVVCILLLPVILPGGVFDSAYYTRHQWWFWTYFQNWLFSITGYPNDRFLRYTWSLCIEEEFYLFWPFLVKTNRKRLPAILVGFMLLANVLRLIHLGGNDSYKYVNTFARIDALSTGALIALLIRSKTALLQKWVNYVLILSVAVIAGIVAYKKSFHFENLYASFTFISLAFGCLIVWSLSSNLPRFGKFLLTNKAIVFLGKHSYGLYLYHVPLLWLGEFYVKQYQAGHALVASAAQLLLFKTAILALTLLVSYLSFTYFEKPVMGLRHKLLGTKQPAAYKSV